MAELAAYEREPNAVVLDPDGRCHRYRPLVPVPVERIDYRGVMRG